MTEVEAMQAVEDALEPLRRDERQRVVEWAKSRFVDGLSGYTSLLSFAAGVQAGARVLGVDPDVFTKAIAKHDAVDAMMPEIRDALQKA